jgi:hypothetical protein
MSTPEQFLGKFGDKEIYAADKQLIFIHSSNPQSGFWGGGLLGVAIGEVDLHFQHKKAEKKKSETADLTLDEKLHKIKGSYAIAYDSVDELVVSKSFSGGQVCIKAKSGWKYLSLTTKEEFKQLSSLLSNISSLKGKLTINQ